MPRSRTYLPDVNVWLALASRRHIHFLAAKKWLDDVSDGQAAFCRITQMGLLRLLTNRNVMGTDCVSQIDAWKTYRHISSDGRVRFLSEPLGIEANWHELTASRQPATNIWTDAYLQAFGRLCGARVVSFDHGFARFGEPEALILA